MLCRCGIREREEEGGLGKRHSALHLIGFQLVFEKEKCCVDVEFEREKRKGVWERGIVLCTL